MKNIMMDMAFTIETDKNFEELTQAILDRGSSLVECWEPEAIGFCDEYELED